MKQNFKMTNVFKSVDFFVLLLVFLTACIKDDLDFDKRTKIYYDPSFAVPLVKTSLTINDILIEADKTGAIHVGTDNSLTLVYRGNLGSFQADDLIKFPTQSYNITTPALSPVVVAGFQFLNQGDTLDVPVPPTVVDFDTQGSADLDSVFFKTGTKLDMLVSSSFQHDVIITLVMPGVKKFGQPLSQAFKLVYAGTSPVTKTVSLDLGGYSFSMINGSTQNQFVVNTTAKLVKGAGSISVTDNASASISFTNPQFDKLFGYIKQPGLLPGADTVNVALFGNAIPTGATFYIANPSVKVIISNSYGVPIQATFAKLEGYTEGQVLNPSAITGYPNPLNIPSPSINQIGMSAKDSFTISPPTSNIDQVLNNIPKNVIFQINATANPAGKPVAPNTNFVLDSSKIDVDFELNLPLYGYVKNIVIADTSAYSLGSETDFKDIESVLYRLYVSNGFPLDTKLQMYFTDSVSATNKYVKLDSLITDNSTIIPGAKVNSSTGKVTSASEKTTDILLTQARLEKIKKADHIIIRNVMQTTDAASNTNVKFYSDYKMDMRMGAKINLKMKIGK